MARYSEKWAMKGGMDIVTPTIERARKPLGALLMVNYEPRDEGFRRVDGYKRVTADAVPGKTGAPTWVWSYRDTIYAWREHTTGGKLRMYKLDEDEWDHVNMLGRVDFRSATGDPPPRGTTVTGSTSNATFRVLRTVRIAGGFGKNDTPATGYFIVDTVKGSAQAAEMITWSGKADATEFTLVGPYIATEIPAAGAHLRFENYNFRGTETWEGMYAATKSWHAFAFRVESTGDAIVYPVIPPDVAERPTHLTVHRNHLALGYPSGRIITSAIGEPLNFDAIEGAADLGIGDPVTGMVGGFRDRTLIFGRNLTAVLAGADRDQYELVTLSAEAGAMLNTPQLMDEPIVYDDRAARSVTTTEAFGDFAIGDVSGKIRPFLDEKRRQGVLPVASTRSRRKSQYRVFLSDGDVIVLTAMPDRQGMNYETSITRYLKPNNLTFVPTSAASIEDSDGREHIYAAGGYLDVTAATYSVTHNGFVYELDAGNNFDGTTIPTFLQLPFNDFGEPEIEKVYKKLTFHVDTYGETTKGAQFRLAADFDNSEQSIETLTRQFQARGQAALWSRTDWSRFDFSGTAQRRAELRIRGRGTVISPAVFTRGLATGAGDEPHIVTGVSIQFLPRRHRN